MQKRKTVAVFRFRASGGASEAPRRSSPPRHSPRALTSDRPPLKWHNGISNRHPNYMHSSSPSPKRERRTRHPRRQQRHGRARPRQRHRHPRHGREPARLRPQRVPDPRERRARTREHARRGVRQSPGPPIDVPFQQSMQYLPQEIQMQGSHPQGGSTA